MQCAVDHNPKPANGLLHDDCPAGTASRRHQTTRRMMGVRRPRRRPCASIAQPLFIFACSLKFHYWGAEGFTRVTRMGGSAGSTFEYNYDPPRRWCESVRQGWARRQQVGQPRSRRALRSGAWRISSQKTGSTVNERQETMTIGDTTDMDDLEGNNGGYVDDDVMLEGDAEGVWRGEDEVAYLLQKMKQGSTNSRRAEREEAEKRKREAEEAVARERALQAELAAEKEGRERQAIEEERLRIEMLSNGVRPCTRPHTRSQAAEDRTLPAVKEIQRLLKRQVRSGRASEVLKVLDTVREEHGPEGVGLTYVYQLAMEACILESRWRDALTLFDELLTYPESPPEMEAYHWPIVAHSALGNRDRALDLFDDMASAGYVAVGDTYNHLMRMCRGTFEALDVARSLMEEYRANWEDSGHPSYMPLWDMYLRVLADAGDWEEALDHFWALVEAKNPAPDRGCYNAALYVCKRNIRWHEAVEIFRHIRGPESEARPDETTYLMAIMALLCNYKLDDKPLRAAIFIFTEMKDKGLFKKLSSGASLWILRQIYKETSYMRSHWATAMEAFKMMKEQGVVVTAEEIKSMLFILSQSKDHDRGTKWKESLELVKEAEERGIIMPLKVYNGVITDMGFAGRMKEAFGLFDGLPKLGLTPTVATYGALAGVCEKQADVDRVFELMHEMYSKKLQPDVMLYSSAISCCGKAKEWQRSLALVVRMQHEGMTPSIVCYNSVINALGMSGEWQRAEAVMQNMVEDNVPPNTITWNTLAQALVIGQQYDRALELMDKMLAEGVQPDAITYGTMITACNDPDLAYGQIIRMMNDMEHMGIPVSVIHYGAAMETCNRLGSPSWTWLFYRRMLANNIVPNNHAYSSLMTASSIEKETQRAFEMLRLMKKEGTQPDAVTYNTMIKACDASWEYALDVLELMELDGMEPNMLCYTAAMGACIVGECYNEAINLYNEMLALGMVLDADALRTARYAHELAGNKEAARAIDEEMKERNLIPL